MTFKQVLKLILPSCNQINFAIVFVNNLSLILCFKTKTVHLNNKSVS
jgi:hypothetical protein